MGLYIKYFDGPIRRNEFYVSHKVQWVQASGAYRAQASRIESSFSDIPVQTQLLRGFRKSSFS